MNRYVAILFVLTATASISTASVPQSGQAPARDLVPQRGTTAATFRIRGRVLGADTGLPVRRAMVHLASSQLAEGRATLTDSEGRYEFQNLPAGNYYVSASKTGFLTALAGNELLGIDSGKPIRVGDSLSPDESAATVPDIVLTRACAIGGRVVDEFGEPVANIAVRVNRLAGGGRLTQMRTVSTTNDLGQYRAPGLLPGTYYVFAEIARSEQGEIGEGAWYAPAYYPGTADLASASPIHLAAGQDMAAADIVLALVRTARLSGLALDSQGQPASGAGVRLELAQPGIPHAAVGNYTRVLPDGSFVVTGVPPGDYWLTVGSTGGGTQDRTPARRPEYGRIRLSLAGSDLSGVTVQTRGGTDVSGQVVFEGGRPPKAKPSVEAFDESTDGPGFGAEHTDIGADGGFVLPAMFGDRVFRMNGLPAGWTLRAVYLSGRDVTDVPVPLDGRGQLTGVQIVVSDRVTHLNATVSDERGRPVERGAWVFIVPEDPERNARFGSRFVRSMVTTENGVAKIEGLPPGDYVAVVFRQSPRHVDVYAPEVLEQVRKTGARFTLREGETRDVVLKLVDRGPTH